MERVTTTTNNDDVHMAPFDLQEKVKWAVVKVIEHSKTGFTFTEEESNLVKDLLDSDKVATAMRMRDDLLSKRTNAQTASDERKRTTQDYNDRKSDLLRAEEKLLKATTQLSEQVALQDSKRLALIERHSKLAEIVKKKVEQLEAQILEKTKRFDILCQTELDELHDKYSSHLQGYKVQKEEAQELFDRKHIELSISRSTVDEKRNAEESAQEQYELSCEVYKTIQIIIGSTHNMTLSADNELPGANIPIRDLSEYIGGIDGIQRISRSGLMDLFKLLTNIGIASNPQFSGTREDDLLVPRKKVRNHMEVLDQIKLRCAKVLTPKGHTLPNWAEEIQFKEDQARKEAEKTLQRKKRKGVENMYNTLPDMHHAPFSPYANSLLSHLSPANSSRKRHCNHDSPYQSSPYRSSPLVNYYLGNHDNLEATNDMDRDFKDWNKSPDRKLSVILETTGEEIAVKDESNTGLGLDSAKVCNTEISPNTKRCTQLQPIDKEVDNGGPSDY